MVQRSFFHQPWHCNLLFIQSEDNINCNLFDVHYLQMIKQKVCLLLENLDPLTNLKNGLVFCWYFWLIFIPVNWFLKPDFNCSTSFVLPWVNSYNCNIKFVSVIENLAPWSVIAVANLDQFVIKINFTISNGTIILPCFVPFLSVWPVIFALRLNSLVALALLKSVTTSLASRAHSSLQYCQKNSRCFWIIITIFY